MLAPGLGQIAALPTRLQPPAAPADALARPRLTEQILRGLDRTLTLICAPAGSGKTTALASALRTTSTPMVWLSLDERDDDPAAFIRSLAIAVQSQVPGACRNTLSLLQLPGLPTPAFVAGNFELDLAELGEELILALDDYHVIGHPDVHALMAALLRRSPGQLHLAVTSRTVPPLPLARLRAQEQLVELDADNLRFRPEETQAFLNRALGERVLADQAAAIQQRTDGWAVGLRLSAIALRRAGGPAASAPPWMLQADEFSSAYLMEEVVASQSPALRAFLLRTSVVERFCAGLADALLADDATADTSESIVASIERGGLFVSRVGERGEWLRYHPLLRDTLQNALHGEYSAAEIRGLHARASAWFARQGLVEDAIDHALQADDPAGAARLVEQHRHDVLAREDWQQLERWLSRLPAEEIERQPTLLVAAAWVAHLRYALPRIPPLLERAEALLAGGAAAPPASDLETLRAEIEVLRAGVGLAQGTPTRVAEHARRAWETLPASAAWALGSAGTALVMALHMQGDAPAALALVQSRRAAELEDQPIVRLRLMLGVAYGQAARAELRPLERTGRELERLAAPGGYPVSLAWAHYVLGRVYYELDDLAAAREQYEAVRQLRDQAPFFCYRAGLQGLALTYQALGQPREAREIAEGMIELALAAASLEQESLARAFRARLALLQGDLVTAAEWLADGRLPAHPGFPVGVEVPTLTRLRALGARGDDADVAETLRTADELLPLLQAQHETWQAIELLALQALAYRARGEQERALAALDRAVGLAAPGGLVRTFVDLGAPLGALLAELAREHEPREYIGRLLAAFRGPTSAPVALPGREAAIPLIEPLTERELDILRLLAGRLANKEIAATLDISWHTVTKHTVNIYQKLQVSDRRAAVERARALGLLPGD